DRILDEVDKIAQTRHTVRRQALLRDGYRCTLTGLYDIQSCMDMPEIDKASLESAKPGAFLEVAHIFSESAQDGDKRQSSRVAAAAAAKGKQLKLPDPVLIAIRAACARVANLSGAAEQIDRILRDKEDMPVLANDGSMAELLSSCLLLTS
ncbi:hypothetical protein E4T56_gene3973, partial [Termitomyces sp. T112]